VRVGLDLRSASHDECCRLAAQADELGLWAVLVGGATGTESVVAAELATVTEHIHLAVQFDAGSGVHPLAIAEEIAVVDHLSSRRALAVVDANPDTVDHVRRLLACEIIDGVALAPPPAQTTVAVWDAADLAHRDLSGDLDADRTVIDAARDDGVTHLFVRWPGDLAVLARHLVTRALTADFPTIVADYADTIAPIDPIDEAITR